MKSSNTQVLDNIRCYRELMKHLSPEQDKAIYEIIMQHRDALVKKEKARLSEERAIITEQINLYNQECRHENSVAIEIDNLRKKIRSAKRAMEKEKKAFEEAPKGASRLFSSIGTQINRLKKESKKKKTKAYSWSSLVNAGKAALQEFQAGVTYNEAVHLSKLEDLNAQLEELIAQRNEINRRIRAIEKSLRPYGLEKTSPVLWWFENWQASNKPEDILNKYCNKDIIAQLTEAEYKIFTEYCEVLVHLDIGSVHRANASPKSCKTPHLFRVVCTAMRHPLIDSDHAAYFAEDLDASIVCRNLLQKLIKNNATSDSVSHFIPYQSFMKSCYGRKLGKTWEIRLSDHDSYFFIIEPKLLDFLEEILTQQPDISFPDLVICLAKAFPDTTAEPKRMELLTEFKRLYEETPEQILITEQRYYREMEIAQLKENARLEREEIARQAEMSRWQAERQAEKQRLAIEKQANADRIQREIERENLFAAEYTSAVEQRRHREEEQRLASIADHTRRMRCANCANAGSCSAIVKAQSGSSCGGYMPR